MTLLSLLGINLLSCDIYKIRTYDNIEVICEIKIDTDLVLNEQYTFSYIIFVLECEETLINEKNYVY